MANELSCHLTQQGLAPSRRHRSLFPRHILPFLHSLHSFLSECPFILFLPIIKSWFNASSNLKLFLILLCGTNLSFLNAPTSLCSAPFPLIPFGLVAVLLKSPQMVRFLDEALVGIYSFYEIVGTQWWLSGSHVTVTQYIPHLTVYCSNTFISIFIYLSIYCEYIYRYIFSIRLLFFLEIVLIFLFNSVS